MSIEPETDDEGNEKKPTVKYVTERLLADAQDLLGNFVDNPNKYKPAPDGTTKLPAEVPEKSKTEVLKYLAQANLLATTETKIRTRKKTLKDKEARLEDLVDAKKYGRDGFINHLNDIIILREAEMAAADKDAVKKKFQKHIDDLNAKKELVEELVAAIGKPITNDEAPDLILQKHHDLMQEQLERYLNREKRELVSLVEKLWDKYAVSRNELEQSRTSVMNKLNEFLTALNYQ